MLTPVERVLVLKGADLLKDVGPRHLLGLANVAREIEIFQGDLIYDANDPADALYIVVEGRVTLLADGRKISEVGPGEAFGTDKHVRISYATSMHELERGLDRIHKFIAELA